MPCKLNQYKMRDAVLNDFNGMSLAENAAAIGVTQRHLSYMKRRPEWQEWERVLRQELSRVAVNALHSMH